MALEKVEEVELFGYRMDGGPAVAFNHGRFWNKSKRLSKIAAPSWEQDKSHWHRCRVAPDQEHESMKRDRPEVFQAVALEWWAAGNQVCGSGSGGRGEAEKPGADGAAVLMRWVVRLLRRPMACMRFAQLHLVFHPARNL
jgi:hypothetical protein